MPVNGPRFDDVNSRVNTVVGLKKYQQMKKVMEGFNTKLQEEIQKQPHQVDHKIK